MARHSGEASEPDQRFAALLRDHREAANLTQEDLARLSGLSAQGISMLERGVRRTPRSSTLEVLARALGLDTPQRSALIAAARGRSADPGCGRRSLLPESGAGIPPDPVAGFVGREMELAELHRQLGRYGRVAVHGLAGVGKTQLAVHYLEQRRTEYPDGVFWLRADRESSLAGLAWRIGLPERALPDEARQVQAVLGWLRGYRRWLLVLDNIEARAQDEVLGWVPPGLPGHILVTSPMPVWPVRLALGVLPLDLAADLLLDGTGQADRPAAAVVAEALGCLPVALSQAAAYLVRTGRDLASYAVLLRTRLVELMEEGFSEGYPLPVATTLRLSYERLVVEHRAAALLLGVCAFLGMEDIPIGVLRDGAGHCPAELRAALADDLEFDRTITALRRYALVERCGDGLRVHRLTQAVIRASLPSERRDAYLSSAIRMLRAGCPTHTVDRSAVTGRQRRPITPER